MALDRQDLSYLRRRRGVTIANTVDPPVCREITMQATQNVGHLEDWPFPVVRKSQVSHRRVPLLALKRKSSVVYLAE